MEDDTRDTTLEASRMDRADLLSGTFFLLLGLVIVYLSWTMPRLEIRGIHPATVPGLVPGLLGGLLAICGALLGMRGLARARRRGSWSDLWSALTSHEALRFAAAVALALVYSLVLVGRLPFWLATALFVFAFIVTFEVWLNDDPKPLMRSAILAIIQAGIVAAVVTAIFQYGFLVRLP